MFSYVVAKYKFKFCKFLYAFSLVIMMIPIYGSMPANVKVFFSWGLADTPFYLIGGMGVIGGTTWLIFTSFMESLPWTYAEAVFIDGGGHGTAFFKIMLPQAWPPMLTLAIMSFIGSWNDYMTTLLYMPDFPTLASGIYRISKSMTRSGNYPQYFAGLVVSIIPVIALYATFSDMIMENFTVGGLKG
jgi:ABC-type glycerol-3-phosphate transport system permease component